MLTKQQRWKPTYNVNPLATSSDSWMYRTHFAETAMLLLAAVKTPWILPRKASDVLLAPLLLQAARAWTTRAGIMRTSSVLNAMVIQGGRDSHRKYVKMRRQVVAAVSRANIFLKWWKTRHTESLCVITIKVSLMAMLTKMAMLLLLLLMF